MRELNNLVEDNEINVPNNNQQFISILTGHVNSASYFSMDAASFPSRLPMAACLRPAASAPVPATTPNRHGQRQQSPRRTAVCKCAPWHWGLETCNIEGQQLRAEQLYTEPEVSEQQRATDLFSQKVQRSSFSTSDKVLQLSDEVEARFL
ncbi:uncharacterized protein LOC119318689 isoform X1 [Triticum dicoccoides]|uniref:uncharacterized protein LOC119318689 isoform X1 n=1 Tax=Triticum dicoccoides TaxID=85692 RepID=UPI00188F3DDE|nr:uncharacterized protein LOC119318689 isoform X1 [Triticum dicoccoides]XP_044384221.1 uncharacterized protein LOC123106069 isoform X2 [Triticum aestivum]XP_044384228.1 uncharacterized protein LOC123106069 isoform X2 [Triticum aestivum]